MRPPSDAVRLSIPDIVVSDRGVELLAKIKERSPSTQVVMVIDIDTQVNEIEGFAKGGF